MSYDRFDTPPGKSQLRRSEASFHALDFGQFEGGFDEEYQLYWDMINTRAVYMPDDFVNISRLVLDFQYAAVNYGKVIISEKHLDNSKRSIQAITDQIGGYAGGEKFIAGDMFFR